MKYLNGMVACIMLMFATACNHHHEVVPDNDPAPSHTLLIYMAGDNSLSDYCKENIRLIKKGLMEAPEDMNVIIYKDNRDYGDALPKLFQLKRVVDKKTHIAKIDTIFIQELNTELDSCDPKEFEKIVKLTFDMFNTEVKGLEIWSHGMSWIPSDNFTYESPTRGIKYFGQDNSRFMELWDIRKALENTRIHFDYISFDACFAGMGEVANEFDQVCDYIYAPITEIMGCGFPYDTMIQTLSFCQNKNKVCETLIACVNDFAKSSLYVGYGYTITLLETKNANNLSIALAELRNAAPHRVEQLDNNKHLEANLQHYGRSIVDTRYYFYEFQDYVDFLAQDETAEVKNILQKISNNNIVVAYANSDKFVEGESIDLKGCKGLGISIPEIFSIYSNKKDKNNFAYGMTKWGKNLGFK